MCFQKQFAQTFSKWKIRKSPKNPKFKNPIKLFGGYIYIIQ